MCIEIFANSEIKSNGTSRKPRHHIFLIKIEEFKNYPNVYGNNFVHMDITQKEKINHKLF